MLDGNLPREGPGNGEILGERCHIHTCAIPMPAARQLILVEVLGMELGKRTGTSQGDSWTYKSEIFIPKVTSCVLSLCRSLSKLLIATTSGVCTHQLGFMLWPDI